MKLDTDSRGFTVVAQRNYPKIEKVSRLLQESSAIGEYEDAWDDPGSSFLWISENFHLNREEVKEVSDYLLLWLNTGHLKSDNPPPVPGEK